MGRIASIIRDVLYWLGDCLREATLGDDRSGRYSRNFGQ